MIELGIINVNTSSGMTTTMVQAAERVAAPDITIHGITPSLGPVSVESHVEASFSVVGMLQAINSFEHIDGIDAWILGGFGDAGKEALMENCRAPVIDITEAAAITAMQLGANFGILTTLSRTISGIRDRLLTAGLLQRCVGIAATEIAVLDLESDQEVLLAALCEKADSLLRSGAEALCLGCGGMAGIAPLLSKRLGIPVVDGVTAAVGQAEALVRQGLSTSRINTYQYTPPKPMVGFDFCHP
ncbi:MAG: aspartate/glutamate racemase family protein [Corynebacterium sp.]|nr:aspartate/glutamate racemase family protein [Corynebacterium sp.]